MQNTQYVLLYHIFSGHVTCDAQELLQTLREDPKAVYFSGLTPERLPGLVEMNSQVATSCLVLLMSSTQVLEYVQHRDLSQTHESASMRGWGGSRLRPTSCSLF